NVEELRESLDLLETSMVCQMEVKKERSLLKMVKMESEFSSKFLKCLEIGLVKILKKTNSSHSKYI
ncbi:hypothetical protein Avbf_09271, partial [Armadillidium vulgare]